MKWSYADLKPGDCHLVSSCFFRGISCPNFRDLVIFAHWGLYIPYQWLGKPSKGLWQICWQFSTAHHLEVTWGTIKWQRTLAVPSMSTFGTGPKQSFCTLLLYISSLKLTAISHWKLLIGVDEFFLLGWMAYCFFFSLLVSGCSYFPSGWSTWKSMGGIGVLPSLMLPVARFRRCVSQSWWLVGWLMGEVPLHVVGRILMNHFFRIWWTGTHPRIIAPSLSH